MDAETRLKIEERIIAMLKTVYDPEIPVNIYDLGLIYKIDLQDDGDVSIDMTLTAPNCPAADFIMEDVRQKVDSVEGVNSSVINLVFEPEWDKDMMSEEAKLVAAGRRAQCRAAGGKQRVLYHRAGRSVGVFCAAGRIGAGQLRAGSGHRARQAAREAVAYPRHLLQFPVAVPI